MGQCLFKVGQLFQSAAKVISKWGKMLFQSGALHNVPIYSIDNKVQKLYIFCCGIANVANKKFLYNFFSVLLLFRPGFFILIIQKVVRTIFNINLFFTIQYGNMYSFYKQCFV